MGRGQRQRGFTIAEVIVSTAMVGAVSLTLVEMLRIGQQSWFTNEAFLEAHRAAQQALDAVAQDLEGAQIYGYYNVTSSKTLIQFRRLHDDIVDPADPAGNPKWTTEHYMYIWCPAGAAGPGDPFWGTNSCANIVPAPGNDQLVLVKADPNVSAPQFPPWSGTWRLQRVVVNNLQNHLNGVPGDQRGFNVVVRRASNGAGIISLRNGCTPSGEGQYSCYNILGNPFGLGYSAASPLYLNVELTLNARNARTERRIIRSAVTRASPVTRNRQDLP